MPFPQLVCSLSTSQIFLKADHVKHPDAPQLPLAAGQSAGCRPNGPPFHQLSPRMWLCPHAELPASMRLYVCGCLVHPSCPLAPTCGLCLFPTTPTVQHGPRGSLQTLLYPQAVLGVLPGAWFPHHSGLTLLASLSTSLPTWQHTGAPVSTRSACLFKEMSCCFLSGLAVRSLAYGNTPVNPTKQTQGTHVRRGGLGW